MREDTATGRALEPEPGGVSLPEGPGFDLAGIQRRRPTALRRVAKVEIITGQIAALARHRQQAGQDAGQRLGCQASQRRLGDRQLPLAATETTRAVIHQQSLSVIESEAPERAPEKVRGGK